jgi:hypothetical protein
MFYRSALTIIILAKNGIAAAGADIVGTVLVSRIRHGAGITPTGNGYQKD